MKTSSFIWQTPELNNTWMLKDHNRARTKEKSLLPVKKQVIQMCLAKGILGLLSWAFLPQHSGCCHFLFETKVFRLASTGYGYLADVFFAHRQETSLKQIRLLPCWCWICVLTGYISSVWEWSLRWGQGSLCSKEQLMLREGLGQENRRNWWRAQHGRRMLQRYGWTKVSSNSWKKTSKFLGGDFNHLLQGQPVRVEATSEISGDCWGQVIDEPSGWVA